jgi:hypothetical protein
MSARRTTHSAAQFILADATDLRVYFRSAGCRVCADTPNGSAFNLMMMTAETALVPRATRIRRATNTVRKVLAFALIIRPMH